MLMLKSQQSQVGSTLQEGGQLLVEGKLSETEVGEVEAQMELLNSRWEAVRLRAMDRQAT